VLDAWCTRIGEVEPGPVTEAMAYSLRAPGKRIRPAFVVAAFEALDGEGDVGELATAVEIVHTYSLVHDDLPCMDDDRTRRGRPTVHVAFGEAVAVLAGDALLAAAFAALLDGAGPGDAGRRVAAARDLAGAAGSLALVGGQVDDLRFSGGDAEAIESVHARKSAALIAASVTTGARLGGAGAGPLARLARFGRALGVAFQIADDLLDAGDDEACSLVRVLGPEGARARADALLASALAEIEELGLRAEPLRVLARYAVRRDE